jgi:branched-chain amino acid transport system ATP-binding protein
MHASQIRPAFELRNIFGGWGPTSIIEGVSLTIAKGETVALVGRNSVGKSTLMELTAGRARLSAGEIIIGGSALQQMPVHRRVQAGLAYVPQAREVFHDLTVAEHFNIASRPGRWTKRKIFELFPSLQRRDNTLAGRLSGGEQQMLAIGRALVCNPQVLLMDEPSEGLAPVVVDQLVDALRAVMEDRELAILLVEQRIDIALEFSQRCLVMDRGRIVFEGEADALRDSEEKINQLMGLGGSTT